MYGGGFVLAWHKWYMNEDTNVKRPTMPSKCSVERSSSTTAGNPATLLEGGECAEEEEGGNVREERWG
jgi:hypothetical protein